MQTISRSEPHGSTPFLDLPPAPLPGGRGNEPLEPVYGRLVARLSRSATDWAVTDADARAVQGELQRLSPKRFAQVISWLERDGLLDTFLDEASQATRNALLDDAVAKGVVQAVPGKKADKSAAQRPPDGPALLFNSPSLPMAFRQLIHQRNVASAAGYYAAHRAYVDRYLGEVERSTSAFQLRALGEPHGAFSLSEPGLIGSDSQTLALSKDWSLTVGLHARDGRLIAYKAMDDKLRSFVGAQRAGSLYAKAAAKMEFKYGSLSTTTELNAKFSPGLAVTPELKQKLAISTGDTAIALKEEISISSKGKTERTSGLKLKGEFGAVSVKVKNDGSIRTELGAAYSELGAKAGTLEGGLGKTFDLGKAEASLYAAVGFKGSEKARVTDAISSHTLFGPMPELDSRTPWSSLPKARQEALYRAGINQAAWDAELQRR